MLPGRHGGQRAWSAAYRILADYPPHRYRELLAQGHLSDQVWLDGLYMGCPSTPPAWQKTARTHWDDILDQFNRRPTNCCGMSSWVCTSDANDCSRKMEWADPITRAEPGGVAPCRGLVPHGTGGHLRDRKGPHSPCWGAVPSAEKRTGPLLWPLSGGSTTGMFLQVCGPGGPDRQLLRDLRQRHGRLRPDDGCHGWGCCPPEYGEKGSRVLDGNPGHLPEKGRAGLGASTASAPAQVWDRDPEQTATRPHRPPPEYYLSEKADGGQPARCQPPCMMAVSEQLRRA